MIEPESQHHALVEIALRAGIFRVDDAMKLAHAREQRRARARHKLGIGFRLRRAGDSTRKNRNKQQAGKAHLIPL